MKPNPLSSALLVLLAVAIQLPAQQPATNATGTKPYDDLPRSSLSKPGASDSVPTNALGFVPPPGATWHNQCQVAPEAGQTRMRWSARNRSRQASIAKISEVVLWLCSRRVCGGLLGGQLNGDCQQHEERRRQGVWLHAGSVWRHHSSVNEKARHRKPNRHRDQPIVWFIMNRKYIQSNGLEFSSNGAKQTLAHPRHHRSGRIPYGTGLGAHISHFRIRSADFQSAFTGIAATKPTASRRSGLSAFRAAHEISGLIAGTVQVAQN